MELIELEYEKINGLLYLKIEIEDNDRLQNLGKFVKARLEYLHS